MNFAKNLAYRIEQWLHRPGDNWSEDDEENACQEILKTWLRKMDEPELLQSATEY